MADRFMRLLVFFDLPVNTKKRRKEYARFRKALIQDGFLMLQYSVYVRLARNHDDAKKHMRYVEDNLPPAGSVRALTITDKQYVQMKILCGQAMADEHFLDSRDLLEV